MKTSDSLYSTDFGGTGKVIVLLHGFLSSSKYWQKLQPLLTRTGYRVVTIDLLGFGSAAQLQDNHYGYPSHVEHIRTILESHNINKDFILVGHSMGALIATRFCTTHPDKVTALILLHPPLYRNTDEARKTLRNTSGLYRFLLDSRYRELGWKLMKVATFSQIAPHSSAAREKSLENIIEKAEIFGDLATIPVKTLLIVGQRDRKEYLTNLHRHPLSTLVSVTIEDTNHHSPRYDASLIQKRTEHFIETLPQIKKSP